MSEYLMNLHNEFWGSHQEIGIGNGLILHPLVTVKPLRRSATKQLTMVHRSQSVRERNIHTIAIYFTFFKSKINISPDR